MTFVLLVWTLCISKSSELSFWLFFHEKSRSMVYAVLWTLNYSVYPAISLQLQHSILSGKNLLCRTQPLNCRVVVPGGSFSTTLRTDVAAVSAYLQTPRRWPFSNILFHRARARSLPSTSASPYVDQTPTLIGRDFREFRMESWFTKSRKDNDTYFGQKNRYSNFSVANDILRCCFIVDLLSFGQ